MCGRWQIIFYQLVNERYKVLDLNTYNISSFSTLTNVPEDIVSDGNFLYVSTPHQELYDNQGSLITKIDLYDGSVVESFEVGLGPEQLYLDENLLLYPERLMMKTGQLVTVR